MTREEKNAWNRRWYAANREKVAAFRKAIREANPERQKAWHKKSLAKNYEKRQEYLKVWKARNREKLRVQNAAFKAKHREKYNRLARERTKANRPAANLAAKRWRMKALQRPSYRILANIRRRLQKVLKGTRKSEATLKLLGCSVEDFKIYLESRWETGMNWENYGTGSGKWSLDHIIPCAIFDLTKPEHQKRCFHFSNIQPMWSVENSSKHHKVVTNQFNLL